LATGVPEHTPGRRQKVEHSWRVAVVVTQ
jgi:hypothetical protein